MPMYDYYALLKELTIKEVDIDGSLQLMADIKCQGSLQKSATLLPHILYRSESKSKNLL